MTAFYVLDFGVNGLKRYILSVSLKPWLYNLAEVSRADTHTLTLPATSEKRERQTGDDLNKVGPVKVKAVKIDFVTSYPYCIVLVTNRTRFSQARSWRRLGLLEFIGTSIDESTTLRLGKSLNWIK